MKYEWDEQKRRANVQKHGIDFVGVETRFITIGLLKGRTVVVVHTERQDAVRIISIRKATKYEEQAYIEHLID